MTTAEVWRKHSISPGTFYKWNAKFGGIDGPNMRWSLDLVSDVFGASRRFRIFGGLHAGRITSYETQGLSK